MKRVILLVLATSGAFLFNGCAALVSGAMNAGLNDKDITTKTASYFGTKEKNIKITDINKGALSTDYKATYNKTLYNCTIYYGTVSCKKPGA